MSLLALYSVPIVTTVGLVQTTQPADLATAQTCLGFISANVQISADLAPSCLVAIKADDFAPIAGLSQWLPIGLPAATLADILNFDTHVRPIPHDLRTRMLALGLPVHPDTLRNVFFLIALRMDPNLDNDNVFNLSQPYVAVPPADDFDRANGPLGPGWTSVFQPGGGGRIQIVSNHAQYFQAVENYDFEVRSEAVFPNDQIAQLDVTMQVAGNPAYQLGPIVRCNNAGECYCVLYWDPGNLQVYRFTVAAGFVIIIGTAFTATSGGTYTIAVSALGGAVYLYAGPTGANPPNISGAADSTFTSGKPGMLARVANVTVVADNFFCTSDIPQGFGPLLAHARNHLVTA